MLRWRTLSVKARTVDSIMRWKPLQHFERVTLAAVKKD